MIKRLSFLCLLLTFSLKTHGQYYSFLNFSTAQGLPQSQVTSIDQDKNGYLWIGTLGGVARFNGKEFATYTSQNGLLNNRINCVKFIDNKLWIGHEGGISIIEKNNIRKIKFNDPAKNASVIKIITFKKHIIIATNNKGLFELKGTSIEPISFQFSAIQLKNELNLYVSKSEDLQIRDLLIVNNQLVVATNDALIFSDNLRKFDKINTGFDISSICEFNQKIALTTFTNGLYLFNPTSKTSQKITSIDSESVLVHCIADNPTKTLWVAANNGIYKLKNGRLKFSLNKENGLQSESIRTLYKDHAGKIWIGTEGKGIIQFIGEKMVHYNHTNGLTSDLILSINKDKKQQYWIGTLENGVDILSKNNIQHAYNFENSNTVWTSLLDVDQKNWFGTNFGLIAVTKSGKQQSYFKENGLQSDKISVLYSKGFNTFFVGGFNGVSLYENGKFTQLNCKEKVTVRSICKFSNNYFCATDKGIFVIKDNALIRWNKWNNTCYSLCVDAQNRMWIGTENGLFYIVKNQLKRFNFSKTPASNFINFINLANHQLYIGTNNGVFVISAMDQQKMLVKNYGIAEGIVDLETNMNASFVDKKGMLWFGTPSGLVSLKLEKINKNKERPQLSLKSILINYQTNLFNNFSSNFTSTTNPISLNLAYNKNNITFEIDGISLTNYSKLNYQFYLEGQDESWSPLTPNSTITYSGLSAGEYVFNARTIDQNGNKSNVIAIPITIQQAFYKTYWFITLILIAIGFAIFKLVKLRLEREREKNENERLVYKAKLNSLEQKSLNASMNRHFIFNSLNSIQYFINTQDRKSANQFLTNFAQLIRKNLDSSEEGNMVTLSQEIERINLYLSLEQMRFNKRFVYEINCPEEIDQEIIIIPAMMLQPFIENSIIHGILPNEEKEGKITVQFSIEQPSTLVIQIDDNGVGIEHSMNSKVKYDGDHKSQGMEITSKRIDLLKKISSNKFDLIGPVQLENENRLINGTRVTLKFYIEHLEN
ncbi:MAG: histidine kinase [Crocinitomicaceae bacterium]|nr:histidine kinase [Crocinitomicaceae bacterium]